MNDENIKDAEVIDVSKSYLVWQLEKTQVPNPDYEGRKDEEPLMPFLNPVLRGFFQAETGHDACLQAAQVCTRLGYYCAVECEPLNLAFKGRGFSIPRLQEKNGD